jgi:hypothetical protein
MQNHNKPREPLPALVSLNFSRPFKLCRINHPLTLARHRPFKTRCVDMVQSAWSLIIAAPIVVYHRCPIFSERIDRIFQHGVHQFCTRQCSYRLAHNFAIKTVDDWRQIDLAGQKLELGNIRQPLLIWPAGAKISGEEIFRCQTDFPTVSALSPTPGAPDNQLFFSQQSADDFF